MNSGEIIKALYEKHKGDVFVDECVIGDSGSRRMDAWAMKKSWANPKIIGYEVKVSRGDFLNDEKYREYLPVCNQFYWICPVGLIKKEEVDADCGLMYVTNTGRIYTKKRRR